MKSAFASWGSDLTDHQARFGLTESDLAKSIVEYGSGASSFNREMQALQRTVVSVDPLYALSEDALEKRVRQAQTTFSEKRQQASEAFLRDFRVGQKQKRYLSAPLDALPFQEFEFQLALCSHALFGYGEHPEDFNYHLAAIQSLCHVALEVRIFPLTAPNGEISPLLGPVMLALQQAQVGIEITRQGVMRIWALTCEVSS